jgi:hypothetical protein
MSKLELVLTERLQNDYSAEAMEELFLRLDRLHDYAASGRLNDVTSLSRAEMQGWLEELLFTTREILAEMGVTHPTNS